MWKGNVFTPACDSVHGGGGVYTTWADTPLGRHPLPEQTPRQTIPLGRHPLGRHPLADTPQADIPRADTPLGRHPRTATAADGTHPIRMHSCFLSSLICWLIVVSKIAILRTWYMKILKSVEDTTARLKLTPLFWSSNYTSLPMFTTFNTSGLQTNWHIILNNWGGKCKSYLVKLSHLILVLTSSPPPSPNFIGDVVSLSPLIPVLLFRADTWTHRHTHIDSYRSTFNIQVTGYGDIGDCGTQQTCINRNRCKLNKYSACAMLLFIRGILWEPSNRNTRGKWSVPWRIKSDFKAISRCYNPSEEIPPMSMLNNY